jgi:hypothetical protein
MIQLITRYERLTKSIDEINAALASRLIPPGTLIDEFIDTTTADTFEISYAQLSPEMQEHVRDTAVLNLTSFDAIIADLRKRGAYAEGWVAFREWTKRQPWLAEALAQAGPQTTSAGELEVLRERYSEQGWAIAALRVEHMRAKTDDERAAITERIAELEREFAEINRR